MDWERTLLSKAAHGGLVDELLARGVDELHFVDKDCKAAWTTMVTHARKYRTPPTLAVMRREHPDFAFDVVTEPLDYVFDEFVKVVKYRCAVEAFRTLSDSIDDPKNASKIDEIFLESARDLSQVVPTTRIERFSHMRRRIDEYRARIAAGTAPAIPFGISAFDKVALGYQRHEYVSIVGWQGTGKSTLLQVLAFNSYLDGATPMIISLEMEAEALYRKFDTMAVNFEYMALKALALPDADVKKWETWAERASKAKNDIIVLDDVGRCSVDRVYAETVRWKPDMVGVDYISLLHGPKANSMWESVTHITQGLKYNARSLKVPVFGVAQTNIDSAGSGARLENISYSRSIGQDSDIVFGLHCDDDMRLMKKMQVRMLKNRDGIGTAAFMYWSPQTGEFREWTDVDERVAAASMFTSHP